MNGDGEMDEHTQSIYDLLIRSGHSAAKALEIAIDYVRGSELARQWVDVLKEEEES